MAKINPAGEVATLLQRLNAVLNGREARQSLVILQGSGLSLPHVVSLYVLDKGAKSMTELAAALRLSLAATSQLVDKLVENRFVERTEALEDRRFKTVRLRPAGRRTLKSLHRARHLELSATVAKLPRAVQRELAHALAAALTHLETP